METTTTNAIQSKSDHFNRGTPAIATPMDAEVDIEILKSVPKQFEINDERSANWLIRKISNARYYTEQVKKWAELEIARAAREEKTLMFLFGRQIEAWVKTEIERLGGKRKSVSLPAGNAGFRSTQPKIVIDDEELVMSWARANCRQAIVVIEKVSKSALDQYIEQTGVLPDAGVHVEPAAEKFFIR